MRMRLKRIRKKDDEVNSLFHDCRADLLIPTEGLACEHRDVEAQLGADYGARRSTREQIVVYETAAIATNPIEEIVPAVVVRDQGNALPGIHQQQTATEHVTPGRDVASQHRCRLSSF